MWLLHPPPPPPTIHVLILLWEGVEDLGFQFSLPTRFYLTALKIQRCYLRLFKLMRRDINNYTVNKRTRFRKRGFNFAHKPYHNVGNNEKNKFTLFFGKLVKENKLIVQNEQFLFCFLDIAVIFALS